MSRCWEGIVSSIGILSLVAGICSSLTVGCRLGETSSFGAEKDGGLACVMEEKGSFRYASQSLPEGAASDSDNLYQGYLLTPGMGDSPRAPIFVPNQSKQIRLYVSGDVQGGWQSWLASLKAAQLVDVQVGGDDFSVSQILQLEAPTERSLAGGVLPPLLARNKRVDVRWRGHQDASTGPQESRTILIQIGDLIHGGSENDLPTDSIGTVVVAKMLKEAVRTFNEERGVENGEGDLFISLMGNHDYSFLTSPQIKEFPGLRRDLGDEDICTVAFPHTSEFGRSLREMPIAARVNRVFLSHTGWVGSPDRPEQLCVPRGHTPAVFIDLGDFHARALRALELLPKRSDFFAEALSPEMTERRGLPRTRAWGVFFAAYWWDRIVGDGEGSSYEWRADYFRKLGVDDIVFGHSSRPFLRVNGELAEKSDPSIMNQSKEITRRVVGGNDARRNGFFALYKTDVNLYKATREPPLHWMLRCASWVAANRSKEEASFTCVTFERMAIYEGRGFWSPIRDSQPLGLPRLDE